METVKWVTWTKLFDQAALQNRLTLEIASVRASWFAVEHPTQIEAEAKRRLVEKLQQEARG